MPPVSRLWKKVSSSTSSAVGVADEDDVDVRVAPLQEQVQQHEEPLGEVLLASAIEPDTSIRQNITASVFGIGTRSKRLKRTSTGRYRG